MLKQISYQLAGIVLFICCTLNCPASTLADIKTVFVIVMENHNWAVIKDSPDCPFINGSLLPQASYTTQFYSPTGVHPSEPNYIWMEAGDGFGIYDDLPHQLDTTNHLTSFLDRAGISWRSYQESMPPGVFPIVDQYPFFTRHCPQLHFKDVISDSTYCLQHVRPYDELAGDLEYNRVARYNFITPNVTNDMHDFVPGFPSARAAGDFWLSHEVAKILASNAYKDHGALFITWDEGTNFTDGPFGMMVLSPLAKGKGYFNSVRYTHSSTLRTIQTIFGVRPFLGDAANAEDLGDLFSIFSMKAATSADLKNVVLTIDGLEAEQLVRIERSFDFSSWLGWSTNRAVSNSLMLTIDISGEPPQFFRAALE